MVARVGRLKAFSSLWRKGFFSYRLSSDCLFSDKEARPKVLELTSAKLQLLCQATEVLLKGWLALKGYKIEQWHVHDIEKIYEKVLEEYGVSKYLDGNPANMLYLNEFYSKHAYRYPLKNVQHIGMLNTNGLKQLEEKVTNLKDGLIIKIQEVRLRSA